MCSFFFLKNRKKRTYWSPLLLLLLLSIQYLIFLFDIDILCGKVKQITKSLPDVVITTKAIIPLKRISKPVAAPMKKPSRR